MIIYRNSEYGTFSFSPLYYLINEDDYKVHKPYDEFFKNIVEIAGDGLLELIGVPVKIKHIHESENVNELFKEMHIDKLIEGEDGRMYILEFQSSVIRKKDRLRFASYQSLVQKETGKETIVIVISMVAKEDSDDFFGYGELFEKDLTEEELNEIVFKKGKSIKLNLNRLKIENGFTPHVKSLTSMDFSLNLNIMDEIVENKGNPKQVDVARLFLIPLMTDDGELRKKLIFKTAELTTRLDYIDEDLFREIVACQLLLADAVLNKEELIEYLKVFRLEADEIIRQVFMHGAVIKAKMAWKDGRRSIISKILSNGFSFEETSKITGLSVEEISEIANSQ